MVGRSDPPSRAAPSLVNMRLCTLANYYEVSVAMSLSTFRRSRFCAYETLSAFRCPSVLCQVPYLLLAGESVPFPKIRGCITASNATRCVFQRRHFMHGVADAKFIVRELRFDSPNFTNCAQDWQTHEIHAFPHVPRYEHATVHHWLSPPG